MKKISLKVVSFGLLFTLLASCKHQFEAPNQGRYTGIQSENDKNLQLVTWLPKIKSKDGRLLIDFIIYPILASAKGDSYQLIINQNNIFFKSPIFPEGINLEIKDNQCAEGVSETYKIKLCWEKNKFSINLESTNNSTSSKSLLFIQNDELSNLSDKKNYTLDELVGRSKFLNYMVRQEAERVFQAKESISSARKSLLPKLNLKSIAGIYTGDYLSAVGTLLPFIFPSNWFKVKIAKEMYEAQMNSFSSLKSNEMNSVETLYYLASRDQLVSNLLSQQIEMMNKVKEGLRLEESVGTIATGTADYFEQSITLIQRDKLNFDKFILNQLAQIAHTVSLPPIHGIDSLASVIIPDLDIVTPIDAENFSVQAQDKSFEIKSLKFLINAAKQSKKEIYYSFLDLDDNNGLGFATAEQLKISKSKIKELEIKIEETKSLVALKCEALANDYNQSLENYKLASKNLNTSKKRIDWLLKRHLQGDETLDEVEFIDQLVDLQFKMVEFSADQISSKYFWMIANANLNRILLKGFYENI